MHSIGSGFNNPYYPQDEPYQPKIEQATKGLDVLTLEGSQESPPPKGLLEVAATDKGIEAFCESLAQRRASKKLEATARFTDLDHIVSLCGSASEKNSAFVQETVNNPHFLGRLWRQDVESILAGQKPRAGILYIEEEWVPIDLTDSCSPKTLYAKLLFSFVGTQNEIVDCILAPGKGVEQVCTEQGAHFLEVDPSIKTNKFFSGFATSNLLRMQAALLPLKSICTDPASISGCAKNIFDVCASITREELDRVLEEDMRRYRRTDRYSNVLPYAINCVETGVEGQDINGSYIRSGNRLFIACQGPSDKTIDAFWQAVIHHGTQTVLALGPTFEGQTEKFSDRYFIFDGVLTLSDGTRLQKCGVDTAIDWQFLVKRRGGADRVINHCILTRTYELISPTGDKTTVKHHHCPTWQDMRGGDPRVLAELITCIEASTSPHVPIVVHCSAGIGRTGTLIAGYELHYQLVKCPEKPLALAATIMEQRHQRYGVVQSVEQVEMTIRYLAERISTEQEGELKM